MKNLALLVITILLTSGFASAQVNEIRSARVASPRLFERSSSLGSGGVLTDVLFNVVFGEIIRAQEEKMKRREEVPGMVSVEAMVHVAGQPSDYYIVHPRVRANWGLFSTDFRFNYVIEEGSGETRHVRTDDWQIVQLNLVTTSDMLFRVGGGFMHEGFDEQRTHGEWTAALQLHPRKWRVGCNAEYRDAQVRQEVAANLEYRLFDQRLLHASATVGAVYQKYYSTVSVWGLQGGMVMKVY